MIELIVVITIATILTTALVVRQNSWNNQLALNTQVYEVALMIRQAQIYSLGVKVDTAGSGDKFNIGYGVHFDTTGTPADRVVLFADRNGNRRYDNGEDIENKLFTRGVKTSKVCSTNVNNGNPSCPGQLKEMDITFFRPEPKANIIIVDANGTVSSGLTMPAFLKINHALSGLERIIKIETNGQISIQ